MFRKLIFIMILVLSGCVESQPKEIISPDGTYLLKAEVKELIVFLNIENIKTGAKYKIDTRASDVHRWSVNWYPNSNVIVLNSSDIGIYAWTFVDGWKAMETTNSVIIEFGMKIHEKQ